MSEMFSITLPTGNASPLVVRGGAVQAQQRHIHVPTSASAAKRSAEPQPAASKLHPICRTIRSGDSPLHAALDAPELFSPPIFLAESFKADFSMTTQVSIPLVLSHSSPQNHGSSEHDDFHVNMGSAIRTLREETPFLFYKDLNYSIYRDDVTFRDPRNTFSGIDKYRLIFWALRFHGQMFFKAIWVEVLRIWQPSDRVIVVRWTVRGIPRVPWEAQGLFEGTSEYKLDGHGKIYEHKVDNVAPSSPSHFRNLALLNLLPLTPSATPTPTFWDRTALPLPMESTSARGSTWERFYLALTTTLDMHHWWVWLLAS